MRPEGFDMPLAEGAIFGSAVGLAMAGLVPVVEIQFLGFSYQAMHQIVGQIARLRYRSQGRFEPAITIGAPVRRRCSNPRTALGFARGPVGERPRS
ncbi:MAG: hypothetical protein Ct9H300mP12_10720 [Acidimicrobiales bacterium]|nr:MAG: hypothetical protein Ct9H300mP12_10720 [Acidimicrobiales bacterium]